MALFGLGRTLKYKNKPGRDLDGLRDELLTLMGLLEGLCVAEPPLHLPSPDQPGAPPGPGWLGPDPPGPGWLGLRAAVESATRKSELRVVEDQVDAVVCAYIALFVARRPEATTTYGDFETGYILTPTLPADLTPSPRATRPRRPGR